MEWSYAVHQEPDGTCRVEVTDEDGEVLPIARQVSQAQAERLIQRISDEAQARTRPIKTVIRDPYFMAAKVIMIKRLPS